jgi:hypothetical protein
MSTYLVISTVDIDIPSYFCQDEDFYYDTISIENQQWEITNSSSLRWSCLQSTCILQEGVSLFARKHLEKWKSISVKYFTMNL